MNAVSEREDDEILSNTGPRVDTQVGEQSNYSEGLH